jgi:hypothetical protein
MENKWKIEWKEAFSNIGGKFQSDDNEVWEYTPGGQIRCLSTQRLELLCNGIVLINENGSTNQKGLWNGNSLVWLHSNLEHPLYSYSWKTEEGNKYFVSSYNKLTQFLPSEWTWTGNKLISNINIWKVIEGSVPHPVILQIAMLKLVPKLKQELIMIFKKEQEERDERRRRMEEKIREKEKERYLEYFNAIREYIYKSK